MAHIKPTLRQALTGLLCLPLMGVVLLGFVPSAYAQNFELQAISDFPDITSGEVPYYIDLVGGVNALAINAAKEEYREKFARADHEFTGPDGIYNITIGALGEIDGDGEYRLLVDGELQGSAVNSPVTTDFTLIEHPFPGISLVTGSIVSVESVAVSNDQIPEGDGYAFARGRWRTLSISADEGTGDSTGSDTTDDTDAAVAAEPTVNLTVTMTTSNDAIVVDESFSVMVTLQNTSSDTVATTPLLAVAFPESIDFVSSDTCISVPGGATCPLGELAPSTEQTVSLTLESHDSGLKVLQAFATADQPGAADADHSGTLSLLVEQASIEQEATETLTEESATAMQLASEVTVTPDTAVDLNNMPVTDSQDTPFSTGPATDTNEATTTVTNLATAEEASTTATAVDQATAVELAAQTTSNASNAETRPETESVVSTTDVISDGGSGGLSWLLVLITTLYWRFRGILPCGRVAR